MRDTMHLWRVILLASLVLSLVMTGCSRSKQVDEAKVRAYADSMVENILQSMNKGDYTGFSRDFDQQMKSALPESVFIKTQARIKEKIGKYISKKFLKVSHEDDLDVAYYMAMFAEEKDVIVRVAFQDVNGEIRVAGFLLDSPMLCQDQE